MVCQATFTTFKRRHHCRCCGRSLCKEHSSNQKALPQFGIYSAVRVCNDCYDPPQSKTRLTTEKYPTSFEGMTASVSKLKLASDSHTVEEMEAEPVPIPTPAFDCTCGMPLCICEPPTPEAVPISPSPAITHGKAKKVTSTSLSAPAILARTSSIGDNKPSLFFSSGQTEHGSSHPLSNLYELTGEGLREAVKNGDVAAVKNLLSQGLDANYLDRQGMSLLHLAALFNFTEITLMLMDAGASSQAKNAQGETPLDCAQPTLGLKMQQRLDSGDVR